MRIIGAQGESRTHTPVKAKFLNPLRLPFRHLGTGWVIKQMFRQGPEENALDRKVFCVSQHHRFTGYDATIPM